MNSQDCTLESYVIVVIPRMVIDQIIIPCFISILLLLPRLFEFQKQIQCKSSVSRFLSKIYNNEIVEKYRTDICFNVSILLFQ